MSIRELAEKLEHLVPDEIIQIRRAQRFNLLQPFGRRSTFEFSRRRIRQARMKGWAKPLRGGKEQFPSGSQFDLLPGMMALSVTGDHSTMNTKTSMRFEQNYATHLQHLNLKGLQPIGGNCAGRDSVARKLRHALASITPAARRPTITESPNR
jgi:hypothetical protein